mgnify:CR=1 FL=1
MKDLEIRVRQDEGKMVIDGKTVVPFESFYRLVIQRKVLGAFSKQWGKQPIIVGSELLTSLASAPGESQENRTNLVLVSIGVGALGGVLVSALVLIALFLLEVTVTVKELSILIGGILGFGLLAVVLMRAQSHKKSSQLLETMEGLTQFLSKK